MKGEMHVLIREYSSACAPQHATGTHIAFLNNTTNKLTTRCTDVSKAYPPQPKRPAPASCSGQPTSACPPGLYASLDLHSTV